MVLASASTGSTSEEQEDGGQEHSSPCSPGEAECVFADVGGKAGVTETVAGFDEDGTLD